MKIFITMILVSFISLTITLVLVNSTKKIPIENYKHSIVYEKATHTSEYSFILKYKDDDSVFKFKTVYIFKLDFDKYEIGDTIK